MLKDIFDQKAKNMGDFYIFYSKKDSRGITFAVATADLSTPYIQERIKKVKVADDEVLLWNWRYDSPLKLKYSRIKKMSPLAAILRNN